MKLTELFAAVPCRFSQGQDRQVTCITYDSRQANADALFVCLPGAFADGHDYAKSAYEKGCRAFLCQRELDLPQDAAIVLAEDTRSTLAEISAVFYGEPAKKLTIIGITGTKGKTTTALLVQAILLGSGIQCGYIGSNGVIFAGQTHPTANTTPESLVLQGWFAKMVASGVTHVVIEVSSQALMHNRVQGLCFDTVVFTNLSEDHIGAGEHDSFESYRAAKRKLFTDHPSRCIVYNADDEASDFMLAGTTAPALSFSVNREKADFYAFEPRLYRDERHLGIVFSCNGTTVKLQSPGLFSVYNGLAALAVCSRYGVGLSQAAQILENTAVAGRFQVVPVKPGATFIIDYAHNGLSLTAALQVLRLYGPKRLICLFGSVGERTQVRRRELAEAACQYADLCILTSDNPGREEPMAIIEEILSHYDKNTPYLVEPDREKAIRQAVFLAQPGDIVLLAGKGHENYQLIGTEKRPFSEAALLAGLAVKNDHQEETICI